ncbi:hypothetical protein KQI65_15940 [bacterium]|nr:hypothetical protein [bacterium]
MHKRRTKSQFSANFDLKKYAEVVRGHYNTTIKPNCLSSGCLEYLRKNTDGKGVYYFLPNPKPQSLPVRHFIICHEPSTQRGSYFDAMSEVQKGNRNFHPAKRDGLLVFMLALMHATSGQVYMTDLSKCAMKSSEPTKEETRILRYSNCQPLLEYELDSYTDSRTRYYLLGTEKFIEYLPSDLQEKVNLLPHYSLRLSVPQYLWKILGKKLQSETTKQYNSALDAFDTWYIKQLETNDYMMKNIRGVLRRCRDSEEISHTALFNFYMYSKLLTVD